MAGAPSTRVTDIFARLAVGLIFALPAAASAQEAAQSTVVAESPTAEVPAGETPAPPLLGVGAGMPPSIDPGMFPPARAMAGPRPLLEVHGFHALWFSPMTNEDAPQRMTESFRMRWTVLRIDAHPVRHLHVVTRIGFMTEVPLLDASVTWNRLRPLNVTFGQFRMPLGAAATTLAPQLVMLDRPAFVYSMTKATFRDVGLMLGSGDGGVLDGHLHYRFAVASGNGRVVAGPPMRAESAKDLLWVGRVVLDSGDWLPEGVRLSLGGTVAYTFDTALDTADPASARAAANLLGRTWAPIGHDRDTLFAGADLTFSGHGFWAQGEFMRLSSSAVDDGPTRDSMGGSLELAYRLPWTLDGVAFQLATRGQYTDPDESVQDDEYTIVAGGLNVIPVPAVRVSAFGQGTFYTDADEGASVGREISLRATLAF